MLLVLLLRPPLVSEILILQLPFESSCHCLHLRFPFDVIRL
jgi:hypothetical protein